MSACSAYIVGVVERAQGTTVELVPVIGSTGGQRTVWTIAARPDLDAARALRQGVAKVFAVRIAPVGDEPSCTVFVGTDKGPRWVRTSLGAGLALCQSGVHGVVRDLACVTASETGRMLPLKSAS